MFQTSVPVPSPGAGVIEERFVEDGATVKAGAKLFKLKLTGMYIIM
jgi:biotin carboxyl carrier protein